jgi:hypothetical protein
MRFRQRPLCAPSQDLGENVMRGTVEPRRARYDPGSQFKRSSLFATPADVSARTRIFRVTRAMPVRGNGIDRGCVRLNNKITPL